MREILFRAKFGEEWKYGYLSVEPKGLVIKEPYELNQSHIWHIDPNTVSQYTGLTDKNGTKIFEGDILEFTYEGGKTPYLIKWDKFDCCYRIWEPDKAYDFCDHWAPQRFEIIDNIFDTPRFFVDGTTYDEI